MNEKSPISCLPKEGWVRLKNIIGDSKANPPVLPVIPVSKSSWWAGVKSGLYPKPTKLSQRITVWAVRDIRKLLPEESKK